jgi:peptidoglycan/xylan/chitin deacetylase (PgdA/CDA1 family)
VNRVPILMYHSIGGPDRLAVRPEAFAEQMAYLHDSGFTPLTFADLVGTTAKAVRKPVVITFDDGYADFHERALPVLDRYGFAATVFLTTGWVRDAGPDAAGRPLGPMLSWAQASEVTAGGIEVAGHGHSHAQLDQLSADALRTELRRSKELIEDRLDRPVTTMAYPYGYSSARVRRAVTEAGYVAACAVANKLAANVAADQQAVPRLTVQATTSLTTFGRVVEGRGIPLIFLREHALTKGWATVRRSRYALRQVRSGG